MAGTSSIRINKRKNPFDDDEIEEISKFQRTEPLKHITLDYRYCDEKNIHELFDHIRLIGYDKPSDNVRGHWHILGVPKISKR
jgi:hypothetical protein